MKTYLGQARLDGERAALSFRGHRVRRRTLVTLFAIDVEGRGRGGDGRSGIVIDCCCWVRIHISCLSFTFILPWRFIFYVMDADDVTVYVKAPSRRGAGGRRRRRRTTTTTTTTTTGARKVSRSDTRCIILSYVVGARSRQERDVGRARVDKGGRGGGVSAARDDDAPHDVAEFERFALAPGL